MKLLYIHQYFKTPNEGGSLRSYYLSKELVQQGHEVIVITSHNRQSKEVKMVEGIQVICLPIKYSNTMDFSQRGNAFLRFMVLAMMESVRHRNIDFCYVMTTPLSTGIIALFNKYILGRPYIFEVGDLWPLVPIDMGLIKSKWKKRLLYFFETIFYRKAKGLVGLSEPITSYLKSIAPTIPAQTIFNISDCEQFAPSKKSPALEVKYKLKDKFVISYTGTFGLANDLCQIIDYAKGVADLPIQFLMVGDGAEKTKVLEYIESQEVQNVQVYDAMSKPQLVEIVNVTDAMWVSFAPVESLHTGSPNKFFDALAAGKLVVTNFEGWIGKFIEEDKCGFFATSSDEFIDKIPQFLENSELLKTYQTNARRLAEQRFELKIQSKKQQVFIDQLFN